MEGAKDKIVRTRNARTDVDNEPSSLLYIMDKPLITFEFASFTFGFSLSKLENNVIKIELVENRTVSHDAIGTSGAAKVLIKPAKAGTGIVAGGSVRAVLELAGVKDVVSKSLGSNSKINVVRATMNALTSQRSAEHIAELRGKTVEELLG